MDTRESESYVTTISVEASGPRTMSETNESEKSVSITMENSGTSETNLNNSDKTLDNVQGVENPGFVEDGDQVKDKTKHRSSNSSFEEIPMSSDTDCEGGDLPDLSPRVITNVRTKNGLTEEQYKEYFMSENELRTSFRRGKTEEYDSNNLCKLCCWIVALAVLAGAVTVAVLIGIGVIATDPVRQVKESRNLQIQNASIEEIQIQTLLEVTNTSGPDVLTNDPEFFFSRQHFIDEIESNNIVKSEINMEQRDATDFTSHNQKINEVKDVSSSGVQSENKEATTEKNVSSVNEEVTTTGRVSAEPVNFYTSIRVFPTDGDVTNVAILPAKIEHSDVTDVQTLPRKHDTRENISSQDKPIDLSLDVSESPNEANSLDYLSEDKIYSAYEGSAHYELSHDNNARYDVAISPEKIDTEGSSDMQLDMHLTLGNNMEEGSGDDDHVKQQIIVSTEEQYFTEIEDEFENQIDEEFLEVNNKVPRLLQATITSNNGLSDKVITINNKKDFPADSDFSTDQFLIDFTK